jgi:hypothetical protein
MSMAIAMEVVEHIPTGQEEKKRKGRYNLAIQGGIYCFCLLHPASSARVDRDGALGWAAGEDGCGRQADCWRRACPASWRVTGRIRRLSPKRSEMRTAGRGGTRGFFSEGFYCFFGIYFPQIIEFKLMFQRVAQVVVLWFAWLQL